MPILEALPLTEATRQWPVWGTTARIVVTDHRVADDARRLAEAELAAVDLACSRFRDDSELAGVQRRLVEQPGRPVTVSPLLAELVAAAIEAADRTGGDVDPTLADDLSALGYDRDYASLTLDLPAARIPVTLSRRIRHRWRDLELIGDRLSMPARVRLDLGASAKAFAADRIARLIAERCGCGVLVSLGGDIAIAGTAEHVPANGWQVLVQDGPDEPADQIRLDVGALASSSTISRRWRHGTSAVHHILDPASGRPADPVFRTVSVAAPTCAEANALSTSTIVRGWAGLDRLRESGYPVRIVTARDEIVRMGGWP